MTGPKLHHHLPEYYQQGFCRHGRIWVFDRVTGKYRHDQPRNVGAKTHYYSLTDDKGEKDPKIEGLLAQIEDAAKPVFEKLRAGMALTADEKENFSYYLGFFFVRGPRFERMLDELSTLLVKHTTRFESLDDFRRAFDEMSQADGKPQNVDVNAVYAFARSEQYSVHLNRDYALKVMAEQAVELQNFFRQMDWFVAHSDANTAFLTTDNPVVVVPAPATRRRSAMSRHGVITPGAVKIFPVATDTCLLMLDHGKGVNHGRVANDVVRAVNIDVVRHCERLVLGRDEAHVRSLVRKTRVDRQPRKPIFDAGIPTG